MKEGGAALVFRVVLFFGLLTVPSTGCSVGWFGFENFCYKFERNFPKSWTNARADCLSYGGDLVSIHSAEEQAFILFHTQQYPGWTPLWIGLHDRAHENVFEWSDKTSLTYINWSSGQPDNGSGTEDCVETGYSQSRQWNDQQCAQKQHYICKRRKGPSVTCPRLSVSTNVTVSHSSCTQSNSSVGAVCSFSCARDYRLIGPPSINCTRNGTWTDQSANVTCETNDECNNYVVLSGADRAQGFNTSQSNLQCDHRSLAPGWYRFQGAAGDRIADRCVPKRRCGTDATGWMNGKHPTVAEGIVVRKVCYHWHENCCQWSNDIKVRNCGAYFVYELQPYPFCYLRHCGNAGGNDGDCSAGWFGFGNFCYKFEKSFPKSWTNARADCLSYGGDLVSIHSAEEQAFISSYEQQYPLPKGTTLWIGLHDRVHENMFEWSDKTSLTYTNWLSGEPNNLGGEDCVETGHFQTTQWNDQPCALKEHYICKRQKGPLVTCPRLSVSTNVTVSPSSCAQSNSSVGAVCSFSCARGYRRIGPPSINCTGNGTWTDQSTNVICEDERVVVNCGKEDMSITLPKSLLRGLDRHHLRLINASCQAIETASHYTLKTPLTGCGTTSRHTNTSVVYTNEVIEMPGAQEAIIRRERKVGISFSCYYDNNGVVSTVGLEPTNRKLVFSGKGNFSLSLDMFPDQRFKASFSDSDFPVVVLLRQRLYFQVSVTSADQQLSIMAQRCFATPTQDKNGQTKYEFITDGCPEDDTLQFPPAPSGHHQRFSLEAFEFIAENPFVFIHCEVKVCNATNPDSACVRGCPSRARRAADPVPTNESPLYSLAQGPIVLERNDENEPADDITNNGVSAEPPLIVLVLLCVVSLAGTDAWH